jgi:hypothetical protein
MDAHELAAMHCPRDSVVLFVDLLGFAELTEKHELDRDSINAYDRPLGLNFGQILKAQDNALTRAFGGFHRSIRFALDIANMTHPLTAITFSDSAFIATDWLFQAVNIATTLVQGLMRERIPVRIGIAAGSFAALRFRSNVTHDGGDHAAHFLGTAVVRAYAAETCGVKGLRILLHPSAASLLSVDAHNPGIVKINTVECPPSETLNRGSILYEVNYWNLRPTAEAETWKALQDMWSAAPENVHVHYQATAEAIDRMRVRGGAAPLTSLRRRTLPRDAQPSCKPCGDARVLS